MEKKSQNGFYEITNPVALAFSAFVAVLGLFNRQVYPTMREFSQSVLGVDLSGSEIVRYIALIVLGYIFIRFVWYKFTESEFYINWMKKYAFNSIIEIEEELDSRCIGILPDHGFGGHGGANPRSLMSESCQRIGHDLLYNMEEKDKIVLVTSQALGEGKSTLASMLAMQQSELGVRVLIIDADNRRPNLHRIFHVPLFPGLSDCINGDRVNIIKIRDGLDIICAGKISENPSLNIRKLINKRELFAVFRDEYDLIIIDAPPTSGMIDAVGLASVSDVVIMTLDWSRVTLKGLRFRIRELKRNSKGKIVFCINRLPLGVAGTTSDIFHSWFGYGYGYGYGYDLSGSCENAVNDDEGKIGYSEHWRISNDFGDVTGGVRVKKTLLSTYKFLIMIVVISFASIIFAAKMLTSPSFDEYNSVAYKDNIKNKEYFAMNIFVDSDIPSQEKLKQVSNKIFRVAQSWQNYAGNDHESLVFFSFIVRHNDPDGREKYDRLDNEIFPRQFEVTYPRSDFSNVNLNRITPLKLLSIGEMRLYEKSAPKWLIKYCKSSGSLSIKRKICKKGHLN